MMRVVSFAHSSLFWRQLNGIAPQKNIEAREFFISLWEYVFGTGFVGAKMSEVRIDPSTPKPCSKYYLLW